MSSLTFNLKGDARQVNALRQAIKAKLPVLVLKSCVVEENTTQYDNEYIHDRLANIPVNSVSPKWVGVLGSLNMTNTTNEVMTVTPSHFEVALPAERENHALFPPSTLRTIDGIIHTMEIPFLNLKPKESIKLKFTICKALSGDDGRYSAAPVCHFRCVVDRNAAAKAYESLPEETRTAEHRRDWDLLHSHQYTVPNSYVFSVNVLENCGYTNTSAIATACDILIEHISKVKMLKISTDDGDENHYDIVMDEFVGYLFEYALFEMKGVEFVKYGKRHPHDERGTLRIKTESSEIEVDRLIQDCIDPLRRFYMKIAAGPGGRTLHPSLQKAFDSFKKASYEEKIARLVELGVDKKRTDGIKEEDMDTMAEVWLRQTELKAVPTLASVETETGAKKKETEETVKIEEETSELSEKDEAKEEIKEEEKEKEKEDMPETAKPSEKE